LTVADIAEHLADIHDIAMERRIPNRLPWPYMFKQFVLEDHPVIMPQKIDQYLIDLGPQWDEDAAPVQLIALGIETIVAKDIAHRHRLHLSRGTSIQLGHQFFDASYHNYLMELDATFILGQIPNHIFPI
jgi:hypothetical protein